MFFVRLDCHSYSNSDLFISSLRNLSDIPFLVITVCRFDECCLVIIMRDRLVKASISLYYLLFAGFDQINRTETFVIIMLDFVDEKRQ